MDATHKEAMIGKSWLNGSLQYAPNPDGTGETVGYHKNGAVWFRCSVLNGNVHGIVRIWYPDGKLAEVGNYLNGIAHGPAQRWYRDGIIESEHYYQKGLVHGIQKKWFPNGTQSFQSNCSEGRMNGPCLQWYQDGTLEARSHYANGQRHGTLERFSPEGKLLAKELYVRGVRVPSKTYQRFLAGELPAKEILAIRNVEVRRILVGEFGYARILAQMPHEVIDRDGEQELVRILWSAREEPICLVKVKCPSTGAFYTLRVPPSRVTVKSAVAWTFDVKADEYDPIKET
jgi:hypothetical protein